MSEERAPGDVFAVPLRRGWWGAGRLIEVEANRVPPVGEVLYTFLVLDGFWRTAPRSRDVEGLGAMTRDAALRGREAWKGWFKGEWPERFEVVARSRLSRFERAEVANPSGTMVYQSARHFARALFDHWRLLNERDAYLAERREMDLRREAETKAKKAARRKSVTLASMARERPFGHWGEIWPPSVVAEARRIFREATRELMAIEGSSREKRARRVAVVRGIVDAFNALDEREECIETTEREDVVSRIVELASLVGLDDGRERLTGHRDW